MTAGIITTSFFFNPIAKKAKNKAEVPLLQVIANFAFNFALHKFSNLCKKENEDDGLIYSNKKNVLSLSVNYYPPKDGYLSKHKDVKNTDLVFWMIFNLTFKDEHFEKGGLLTSISPSLLSKKSLSL